MDRLSKYLLLGFWPIFTTIFTILFLITSIIIIISISNVTSNIQITFLELLKMYLLSLPKVLFIAFSISFFIAVVSLFTKHSESQEIIALFSSGIKPFTLLKPFLIISVILSFINLLILFVSIPYAKIAFKNFKTKKQQVAKFNFQTAKISQKFGNWNVFTSSQKDKTYENLILFNNKKNQFILAKKANLNSKSNYLIFKLKNGSIYEINKTSIVDYKTMFINQKIPKSHYSIFKFSEYFNEFKSLFSFYLPFALLPIALIFFVPTIAFFHPRIHKNRALIYSFILIVIYLSLTKISKSIFITLGTIVLFTIISFIFYKRKTPF